MVPLSGVIDCFGHCGFWGYAGAVVLELPGLKQGKGVVGGFKAAAKGAVQETARVGELIATHGKTMSNKQLDKLTKNIRAEGIKEPLTVTSHDGKLYILDGHHRALAAPRAGVAEVPINRVELPFGAYKSPADLTFTPGGF
ncbi:MAG: ParB-like nuclease domain-containing protein [Burkholderiales bacterium]|nr:ParB-like nuclease domain-containing protein [Burkholderiales bacterium]